jgi:hypothetical protein
MPRVWAMSLGLGGFLLAIALALPQSGRAREALPVNEPAKARVSFQEFTLPNGLRVILAEDHAAPTYSLCVS